ncbi:MAG TPA: hypothetical protein VKA14_04250 [Gammaproteobacteria bacterium]|nr:hypothetical protein [Gammaproteobacteria bacterium]
MAELVLEPTSTAQWHALVSEAARACRSELDESLESYLVFLLMRFATRADVAARVLALDYLRSVGSRGRVQAQQLREVGDHCLLYSGLYPRRAERRLLRVSYFVGLGRTSYRQVSQVLHQGGAEVYARLAECFVGLMDVLQAMRSLDGGSALDPLGAAELWQDTGSRQARDTLAGATAAVPAPRKGPQRFH